MAPALPNIDDPVAGPYGGTDFREAVRSFLARDKPERTGQ